ncbi:c-di-GMP-binding flagellar brake protein YcgR, contains PilZNR and PilZ domains [Caminicella sporogenes DSM 14501]|uniref:C-di-GMP-binding flagellar brake protein YcgR, contains PilZNR and PilZ domains n=1 Tax=Caminicella sporogenes DSM 14501 TaxID=1121266 RepID=A0A1M6LAK5_9FIRM|nr:PilZ domain-containing protein [Caminicella sporogenes]RKD27766.1 hypothetical protein BET04_01485 [Caminicella sporogenes]SHJ68236.1 c-di-GMP-binding flagellar brake protein YcgR, contains PilZNR and PilZ domains [Caminicella sporogenes DSM 14501]
MNSNISSLIKAGDNIEIEIINKDLDSLTIKSTVANIHSDNVIVITTPIYKGRFYPIHVGKKLNVIFCKKNRGKYYFLGEVIKRENKDKIPLLYINKTGSIRKMQRREFFRLDIILNVIIEINNDENEVKQINAISKDISGGGIRIICKEKLNLNRLLKCIIPLDNETIELNGKVVRCQKVPDSISKYDIGIEFVDIDESIRKKIISFIFKKQRKIIKKGLI